MVSTYIMKIIQRKCEGLRKVWNISELLQNKDKKIQVFFFSFFSSIKTSTYTFSYTYHRLKEPLEQI